MLTSPYSRRLRSLESSSLSFSGVLCNLFMQSELEYFVRRLTMPRYSEIAMDAIPYGFLNTLKKSVLPIDFLYLMIFIYIS